MKGFTLIELLCAMAIFCLIVVFGLPTMEHFIRKNEALVLIDGLNTLIREAKIQAISQGRPLTLSAMEHNNWARGVILWYWDLEKSQRIIVCTWPWSHTHWYLFWRGALGHDLLISNKLTQAMSNGAFELCHNADGNCTKWVVNKLGRVNRP